MSKAITVLFLVLMECGAFRKRNMEGLSACDCLVASQRTGCAGKSHDGVSGKALVELNMNASLKLAATWTMLGWDSKSHGFMNKARTLLKIFNQENLLSMQKRGSGIFHDDFPGPAKAHKVPGDQYHEKITHGIGGHAKAHFIWHDNKYTGMFQKADHCLIRVANAAAPSKGLPLLGLLKTAYNPNMAIKCFRDGDADEANLQTIWEIDGYDVIPEGLQESCSYFKVPLANHCGFRDNISMTLGDTFLKAFQRVDPNSLWLGVSQFATADSSGNRISKPNFPFALVFQPHPDLANIECKFDDVLSQLRNIDESWVGKKNAFEVYAVHDPWDDDDEPDISHIGSVILDSQFASSYYGDTNLFFRHTFFKTELNLLEEVDKRRASVWKTYAKSDHYKREGAAWYQPFLPKKDV